MSAECRSPSLGNSNVVSSVSSNNSVSTITITEPGGMILSEIHIKPIERKPRPRKSPAVKTDINIAEEQDKQIPDNWPAPPAHKRSPEAHGGVNNTEQNASPVTAELEEARGYKDAMKFDGLLGMSEDDNTSMATDKDTIVENKNDQESWTIGCESRDSKTVETQDIVISLNSEDNGMLIKNMNNITSSTEEEMQKEHDKNNGSNTNTNTNTNTNNTNDENETLEERDTTTAETIEKIEGSSSMNRPDNIYISHFNPDECYDIEYNLENSKDFVERFRKKQKAMEKMCASVKGEESIRYEMSSITNQLSSFSGIPLESISWVNGDNKKSRVSSMSLRKENIEMLYPMEKIDDDVLLFYAQLFAWGSVYNDSKSQFSKIGIVSSLLSDRIIKENIDESFDPLKYMNWLSFDIEKVDAIFVIVNQLLIGEHNQIFNHWVVYLLINPLKKALRSKKEKRLKSDMTYVYNDGFLYFDPLNNKPPKTESENITKFFQKICSYYSPSHKIKIPALRKVLLPKQDNTYDCGIIILGIIYLITSANIPKSFQKEMTGKKLIRSWSDFYNQDTFILSIRLALLSLICTPLKLMCNRHHPRSTINYTNKLYHYTNSFPVNYITIREDLK